MRITFLGHAGFCVETSEAIVVTDPWLSPTGAFDSSWFQFPRNHDLDEYVIHMLSDRPKDRYLYISHEHRDHLDLEFLERVAGCGFTVLIPEFRRPHLEAVFSDYDCRDVIVCKDGDDIPITGGSVRVYVDDSELNRDSAILVRGDGHTFLDLNDCRIADALPLIRRQEGVVDVFTCQFSGAGWHPTCYSYGRREYEAIAARKKLSKFRGVMHAIRALGSRLYVPSAGPPCFLDPSLAHLNFEPLNIFPSAQEFLSYLDVHCVGTTTSWAEVAPGDVIDASSCSVIERGGHHVESADYESYISQYMKSYEEFFASREGDGVMAADCDVLSMLERCLAAKLEAMPLRDRIGVPFIFLLTDIGAGVRVDFGAGTVEQVFGFRDESYYAISARSSEVAKVLIGAMTWDEFSLSFRMKLDRKPDVYNTLLQGFIRLEPEDLKALCDRIIGIEDAQERIEVSVGTRRYIVNRYCPHQGGDLARGWIEEDRFLTCPRHQWQFDLCNGGEARMNDGNIYAVPLDED